MHIPEITSEEGNGKGCHQAGSKLGCYKAKHYFNAKDFCQTSLASFIISETRCSAEQSDNELRLVCERVLKLMVPAFSGTTILRLLDY